MPDSFIVASGAAHLHAERLGSGRPVIFLHAGVGDSRMWESQITGLSSLCLAVAFDRRGFGRTTTPDEQFAHVTDLLAVHDSVSADPAVLVGCSQGGRIAIDYALRYPERVAGLVLIAPAISGAPDWHLVPPHAEALDKELDRAEEQRDLNRVNEIEAYFWLDGPLAEEGRVGGEIRRLFLDMNRIALSHPELENEREPESAYERVGRIAVPTTVVWGDLDFPDIDGSCSYLAEKIPGARRLVVQGVAHMVSLERPDVVTDAVRGVLDEIAG